MPAGNSWHEGRPQVTRTEFTKAMAYVGTAIGKPPTADQLEVYFDLLGDLDYGVLMLGVKRVLLEHRWANFPTVATIARPLIMIAAHLPIDSISIS